MRVLRRRRRADVRDTRLQFRAADDSLGVEQPRQRAEPVAVVVGAATGGAAGLFRRADLFDQTLLELRPLELARLAERHRDGERARLPRLAEDGFRSQCAGRSDQIFGGLGGHSINPAMNPVAQ